MKFKNIYLILLFTSMSALKPNGLKPIGEGLFFTEGFVQYNGIETGMPLTYLYTLFNYKKEPIADFKIRSIARRYYDDSIKGPKTTGTDKIEIHLRELKHKNDADKLLLTWLLEKKEGFQDPDNPIDFKFYFKTEEVLRKSLSVNDINNFWNFFSN